MAGKYEPLTQLLRDAAVRGQSVVTLDFDAIEMLVGALPPSAGTRQWWANNSQTQALAWRAAEFHVDTVSLDDRRVRFVTGQRGGSYADRRRRRRRRPESAYAPPGETVAASPDSPADGRVGETVDVRVELQWQRAGQVHLDEAGKPTFSRLAALPGLYRLDFSSSAAATGTRTYIGETENLRRRLSTNYRNPGPRQQTSLRINALLREHLEAGGSVSLALAAHVRAQIDGSKVLLDLTRKADRLLAESAALVSLRLEGSSAIVNLG